MSQMNRKVEGVGSLLEQDERWYGDLGLFLKMAIEAPVRNYPTLGAVKQLTKHLGSVVLNRMAAEAASKLNGRRDNGGWNPPYTQMDFEGQMDSKVGPLLCTLSSFNRYNWPLYYVDEEFAHAMDMTSADRQVDVSTIDWAIPVGMVLFSDTPEENRCAGGLMAKIRKGSRYSLFENPLILEFLESSQHLSKDAIERLIGATSQMEAPSSLLLFASFIRGDTPEGGGQPPLSVSVTTLDLDSPKTIGDLIDSTAPENMELVMDMTESEDYQGKVSKSIQSSVLRIFKTLWVTSAGREHLIEVGQSKREPGLKKRKFRGGIRTASFIGRKYVFRGSKDKSDRDGDSTEVGVRLHLRKGHIRNQRYKNRVTGEYYHKPKFIEPVWVGGSEGEKDSKLAELERLEKGG